MRVDPPSKPKMLRVLWSVACAFFGVQSEANRHNDFQQQSPLPFIMIGLLLAAVLVIGLLFLVNLVVS